MEEKYLIKFEDSDVLKLQSLQIKIGNRTK